MVGVDDLKDPFQPTRFYHKVPGDTAACSIKQLLGPRCPLGLNHNREGFRIVVWFSGHGLLEPLVVDWFMVMPG